MGTRPTLATWFPGTLLSDGNDDSDGDVLQHARVGNGSIARSVQDE
ncbi:MAG: hypothetical protein Q6370_022405 [Candidatus Sigynarchaeota archaeon]